MNRKELIRKGREISYLLRHTEKIIDKHGWADIKTLLKEVNINLETLLLIVNTNDKKRYELSEDGKMIRACQGHSVNVDVELEVCVPDRDLFHGTSSYVIDSILRDGINKMSRQYVHLTDSKDTALNTGKRHGGETKIIVIDVAAMINDGITFYKSKNNVWLTDYVDPKYIKFII